MKLMKSTKLGLCTAFALFGMSASLQADYLANSFESSPIVDPAPANPPYTSIAQSTAAGVTDGTYSMQVDAIKSGAFSWFYTAIGGNHDYDTATYLNWYGHSKLQIDLHRPALSAGWNLELVAAMNGPQGWNQTTLRSWVWQNGGVATDQTLTWDYSAIRNAAPAPDGDDWFQFALSARNNSGPAEGFTIYLDNLRFTEPVPEPTAISLLGLGMGIALLARSRRARSS